MRPVRVSASWLACVFACGPAVAAVVPMQPAFEWPRTDLAMAGVGGIGAAGPLGGGVGTIALAGVSGTVRRALLYWHGIDIEWPVHGYVGGDADYDQAQIALDGAPVTGVRLARFGHNNGWPSVPGPDSAALYRADVTGQVQAKGDGAYTVSGLASGPGHSANGASLIVYFDDGEPANDLRVVHYDGLQSNMEAPWTFAFDVDYAGGPVDLWMHVADGQSVLDDGTLTFRFQPAVPGVVSDPGIRFRSPLHDGLPMWAGASVPQAGFARSSAPGLWDIRRFPLSGRLGAVGRSRVTTDYLNGSEAVALMVAQLVQPADPGEPMLGPTPHHFGDVPVDTDSAPARFTLRNLLPHGLRVSGSPAIASTWYRVAAETCTGRVLAPGEPCTIDVVCRPRAQSVSYEGVLSVSWTDDPVASPVRTGYVSLQCAGVPEGPFSRLEFVPYTHHFGDVPAGATTASQAIALRNTGTLPLDLTQVGVDGTHRTEFSITADGCGARTLQPGAQCSVEVRFRAPASVASPTTRNANLFAVFSASDDASDAHDAALRARAVPDTSGIFRDGYE